MTLAAMMFVLVASAVVPRGYMIAPSEAHGFQITACPDTNPLARLVVHRQSEEQRLLHAAMGHHVDHSDNEAPSTSQTTGDCAFAGLSAQDVATAAHVWDAPFEIHVVLAPPSLEKQFEARPLRLRPPSRGPPIRV